MMKRDAFTLAEVLITLVIIGVIAALTIPTLFQNTQKKEYLTALKKSYASFNQALISLAADNGSIGDLSRIDYFQTAQDPVVSVTAFGEDITKYFKVIKNCKTEAGQGCFSNKISLHYDGTGGRNTDYDVANAYKFVTADGASYLIDQIYPCQDFSQNVTGHLKKTCGTIIVDVNGLKGPNNLGRDIFTFYITSYKSPILYPYGGQDENGGPWDLFGFCSGDKDGTYCPGRIIEEGWQMNY